MLKGVQEWEWGGHADGRGFRFSSGCSTLFRVGCLWVLFFLEEEGEEEVDFTSRLALLILPD